MQLTYDLESFNNLMLNFTKLNLIYFYPLILGISNIFKKHKNINIPDFTFRLRNEN